MWQRVDFGIAALQQFVPFFAYIIVKPTVIEPLCELVENLFKGAFNIEYVCNRTLQHLRRVYGAMRL